MSNITPLSQMKGALKEALQSPVHQSQEPLVIVINQEEIDKLALLIKKDSSRS